MELIKKALFEIKLRIILLKAWIVYRREIKKGEAMNKKIYELKSKEVDLRDRFAYIANEPQKYQ